MKDVSFKPKVRCFIDTDLVQTSFVVTGLIELANAGQIDLSFEFNHDMFDFNYHRGVWTVMFQVDYPDSRKWICIDLQDQCQEFSLDSLEKCDVYYKFNFNREQMEAVLTKWINKIKPFTACFSCRPPKDRDLLKRIGGCFVDRGKRYGMKRYYPFSKEGLYRIYACSYGRWKNYKNRLQINDYEFTDDNHSKSFGIFFCAQCWDENNPAFPKAEREIIVRLNQFRADVIRNLKRVFKDDFIGGFANTMQARKKYPDLITPEDFPHPKYMDQCKKLYIGIYTNGLSDCISWKLGDYLAAGMCVVGEKLRNQLAVPLKHGRQFFEFETVEECIEQVMILKTDRARLHEMHREAVAYYRKHVAPRRVLWDVIMENMPAKEQIKSDFSRYTLPKLVEN